MFRPIAMIVPDSAMIAEIVLFGEGFLQCKVRIQYQHTHTNTYVCVLMDIDLQILARKVNTLYRLAVQQLSKQDHYDFGLRALVSVLKYGGRKKRGNPEMPDEEVLEPLHIVSLVSPLSFSSFFQVLLLAMKDMNVAKLTAADLPLFNGITADLFPGIEVPLLDYGTVCSYPCLLS